MTLDVRLKRPGGSRCPEGPDGQNVPAALAGGNRRGRSSNVSNVPPVGQHLNTRINVTASPTLSLQVYAQPYISAGDYDDWRELADPRAVRYEDRYRPYLSDHDE